MSYPKGGDLGDGGVRSLGRIVPFVGRTIDHRGEGKRGGKENNRKIVCHRPRLREGHSKKEDRVSGIKGKISTNANTGGD